MVGVGHLADLHFGAGTAFGSFNPATGLNTFTEEQVNAAIYAIDQMATAGCKYVLIVGDVFDYPNPSMALNQAFQGIVDHAARKGLIVIVETGNHEKENDRTNALLALFRESDPHYQYVGHGRAYRTPEGLVFGEHDKEVQGGYHIGLYHGIIEGALAGGFALKAPPVVVAKSVRVLLLGDVHMAQQGTYDGRQYFYPGSLVRLNFGEKTYKPSFSIFAIDTDTWQYQYKRFDMTSHSREFAELTYNDIDAAEMVGATLCAPGSILKVTGPSEARAQVTRMVEEAKAVLYRYIEQSSDEAPTAELPKSGEFNVRKVISTLDVSQPTRDLLLGLTTTEEFTGLTGQYRLERLVIKGFGPYSDTDLQFPPEDMAVAVVGRVEQSDINSNGAGKSYIFDAVKTALYGTTYRGLQAGWSVNGAAAEIGIVLRGPRVITIRRTIAAGTGNGKQTVEVWIDGQPQTQDRIGDTQTFIARMLGVSDQTFEVCTMIGKPGLSLVDRTSAWRVDYVMDLFKMSDVDTIADAINQSVVVETSNVQHKKLAYEDAKTQYALALASPVVASNPFELMAREAEKKAADEAVGSLKSELQGIEASNKAIDDFNAALTSATATAAIAYETAKRNRERATRDLEAADQAVSDAILWKKGPVKNCPKCGNIMDDLHATAHVDSLGTEASAAGIKEEEAIAAEEVALTALNAAKAKQQAETKKRIGMEQAQALSTRIFEEQSKSAMAGSLITDLQRKATEFSVYTSKLEQLTKAILDGEMVLAGAQGLAAYYSYVKQHFNAPAIKEQVVNTVKAYLNDTASYYLSRIFGAGVGVQCDVSIQHTKAKSNVKFEIYVLRGGVRVPFEQYSSGERGAVRVAVDLAVSQLVASVCPAQFRFLVFDEAFDNLDAAKSEAVADLIKELTPMRGMTLAVAHKLKIASKFDRTITVEKNGSASTATLS